jgi:hypothetical protein
MAEDDPTISPEMVQRITTERDQARAAAEMALHVDKAYEHFRGKEGIADPYLAAKAAVKAVEWDDEYASKLDSWYDQQKTLFAPSTPPPPPVEPPATTVVPPGLTTPSPSPGNGGGPPSPDPITAQSPEFQAALAKGDREALHKLVSSGRFVPSPGNPYARQAPQS